MVKFKRVIAESDEYISPDLPIKRVFPSFYFYLFHVIRIVLYSNKQAKKNIYDDFRWVNSSIDILESCEKTGIKFHVTGMDNFKKTNGPFVFISNHMSILETFVLPSLIQPITNVVFVIKEELLRFPFFGPVATARNPIVVGRQNPREDLISVLDQGSERLKNGTGIIIFPQRTRMRFYNPSSFNTLGIKLAKKNNVPIIPVAVVSDAWGNGKILKDFGKIDVTKCVHISFGAPLFITGNGNEEHQKSIDFITSKFIEWGRQDLLTKN
jgi:1-acyl-sn-glycerol-3-phosphate acyltransferase